MDIYSLSRNFWNFAFENPDKIKPNHCAVYFFAIEHCNRLGWKDKFGLPTTMVMEAVSIKSYNTYINTFNDLVEIGFFKLHQKSKNQYSSNVIGISNFNKAQYKALDKALIKHDTKHTTKQLNGTSSIDIPIYKSTNIQIYNSAFLEMLTPHKDLLGLEFDNFLGYWTEKNKRGKERWECEKFFDVSRRILTWMKNKEKFAQKESFSGGKSDKGKIQQNFENIQAASQKIKNDIENGTYTDPLSRFNA